MPKFIIQGNKSLTGEMPVMGAKNFALKIIPAALLSKGTSVITNVPLIEDVKKSVDLAKQLGAKISWHQDVLEINSSSLNQFSLAPEIAGKFRASIMFAGPVLARLGRVSFPHPGGCALASGAKRSIDLFLDGFVALGAKIKIKKDYYHIEAKQLVGCEYFFTNVSVTGTESMILAACLAKGRTILKNCALEPEIEELARYLNKQGANIKGAGSPTIIIEGTKKIEPGKIAVMPDRIEAGTFALLAAATKSSLLISHCQPKHIEVLLKLFDKIGVPYEQGQNWLNVKAANYLKACSIKTHEYPGFPTDLQSSYTTLMTQAKGSCLIHETIYDRRLIYVDMLMQMGADIIMCDPHRVVVNGPTTLRGKSLTSPDVRAGTAMIIAGLIAKGKTEINNIYQIDRGYQHLEERLQKIGADIKRVEED